MADSMAVRATEAAPDTQIPENESSEAAAGEFQQAIDEALSTASEESTEANAADAEAGPADPDSSGSPTDSSEPAAAPENRVTLGQIHLSPEQIRQLIRENEQNGIVGKYIFTPEQIAEMYGNPLRTGDYEWVEIPGSATGRQLESGLGEKLLQRQELSAEQLQKIMREHEQKGIATKYIFTPDQIAELYGENAPSGDIEWTNVSLSSKGLKSTPLCRW